MRFPLRFTIPSVLIVFTVALAIWSLATSGQIAVKRVEKDMFSTLKNILNLVQESVEHESRIHNLERMQKEISGFGSNDYLRSLFLIDEAGNIIGGTQFAKIGLTLENLLTAEERDDIKKRIYSVKAKYSGEIFLSSDKNTLWGIYPVEIGFKMGSVRPSKVGALIAQLDLVAPKQVALSLVRNQVIQFSLVLSMLVLGLGVYFHFQISKRIQKLVFATTRYAEGDFETPVNVKGRDEITTLAESMREMAQKRKRALEELDAHQNKLEFLVKERTLEVEETFNALKESQRTLSTVMSNVQGMAYRCKNDQDWTMEYISEGCENLTGYKPHELINNQNLSYNDLIHSDDQKYVWDSVEKALKQSIPFNLSYRIVTADEKVKWVWEQGRGVLSESGDLESLEGFVSDITSRVKAENEVIKAKEEAEQANHSKSEFLSQMSHELRTPLNAIIGFSQVLERNEIDKLTPDQKEDVDQIQAAGKHLLQLINEILDLSYIESGKMDLSLEPVSIVNVLEEVLVLTQLWADQNNIEIINEITQEDVFVLADQLRLKQVLLNLVSNAVKYNREGGSVTLSCEETSNIRISITDTGLGIPLEKQDSLFEPFCRLHEQTEIEGTGIGLAISKKLVELMHGKIRFTSVPDQGSCFSIELSKCEPSLGLDQEPLPSVASTTEPERNSDTKYTILYVEDNPMNLALIEKIIKLRKDIKLLSAPQAKLGLELARSHRPDLILMDIHLPGMDGLQALEYLKTHEETRNIPVIAVTANAMKEDIKKALQAGFSEYITKPIDMDQFLKTISGYLI